MRAISISEYGDPFHSESKERSDGGPMMSAESRGIQNAETTWWRAVPEFPAPAGDFPHSVAEVLRRVSARCGQVDAAELG